VFSGQKLTVFDFIAVKMTLKTKCKTIKISFESDLVKLVHLVGRHVYGVFQLLMAQTKTLQIESSRAPH
jgi:hypothetical protein